MVQCTVCTVTVCFLYIGPDKQGKFIERMKPKEIGSRGSFLDLHILLRSGAMHCMQYAVCTQLPIPTWQTGEKYLRVQMLEQKNTQNYTESTNSLEPMF